LSDVLDTEEGQNSGLAQLRFLAHLKEYGIVYAVAYFIAQDLGLLTSIAETAGGMC